MFKQPDSDDKAGLVEIVFGKGACDCGDLDVATLRQQFILAHFIGPCEFAQRSMKSAVSHKRQIAAIYFALTLYSAPQFEHARPSLLLFRKFQSQLGTPFLFKLAFATAQARLPACVLVRYSDGT